MNKLTNSPTFTAVRSHFSCLPIPTNIIVPVLVGGLVATTYPVLFFIAAALGFAATQLPNKSLPVKTMAAGLLAGVIAIHSSFLFFLIVLTIIFHLMARRL